ncbi:Flavonol 3-sulfotransferase, putative [Ricinus communis]|uniref:Sulfotransferase n=1 Tax=Ricinus communis TaxID=3988 RepID=B9SUK2_RICCO|nr:Flavonol 3-sulfotransferase, putative [Ricinus communis]
MESSSLMNDNVSVSETSDSPRRYTKYEDIISTLPQEEAQENFTAQPTDIIISSFPKSGTTWLKALCFAILRRNHLRDASTNRLLTELPHDIVPFIDYSTDNGGIRVPNDLPLWATHIPYSSLPKSILESNCKIIFIGRNPKDVFVSLWHFISRVSGAGTRILPLEEVFQGFCKGVTMYGPYWDHVLGYWKASLQFPDRILFIKYEDLQLDTLSSVKRLAEFMGCPFTMEEERQGLVQEVVDLCSFQLLSNLEVNKSKEYFSTWPAKFEHNAFFRKGKIGDWENYLTPEMVAQLDEITEKKFGGSGLSFVTSITSPTP